VPATSSSKSSSSAYNKMFGSTSKVVESAKTSLLKFVEIEESTEAKSSEIVVKENVSLAKFLSYREKDSRLPVRVYLCDKKIIINEVPTETHGMVLAMIKVLMGRWNVQDLRYSDDTTMILGPNSAKEPDSWVRPRRLPRPPPARAMNRQGSLYPTMTIEVGYTQSLLVLLKGAWIWVM